MNKEIQSKKQFRNAPQCKELAFKAVDLAGSESYSQHENKCIIF
jgi:hypothetical protein